MASAAAGDGVTSIGESRSAWILGARLHLLGLGDAAFQMVFFLTLIMLTFVLVGVVFALVQLVTVPTFVIFAGGHERRLQNVSTMFFYTRECETPS